MSVLAAISQGEKRRAWLKAACRRNELIRLGQLRAKQGRSLDTRRFAFAAAATLASAPAGRFRVRSQFCTWHGLDGPALVTMLRDARVAEVGCDDDLISWALGIVECGNKALSHEAAGALVDLTAEERELLSIRTLEAIDESKAEREARQREVRKVKDAQRKKRSRPLKPKKPSAAETKPWDALKMSRATYYRCKKRETETSAKANAETEMSAETYGQRETALSARLKCPHTHVITGKADKTVSRSQEAASGARSQRSGPSSSPSAGAGFGGEDGTPVTAFPEAGSTGSREGLGDGCRPESEAPEKGTGRPSRAVPEEDPRAALERIFDRNTSAFIAEELGEGDHRLGYVLAARLGPAMIDRLRRQIVEAGGAWNADHAIAAARTVAVRMQAEALRRVAR